MNTTQRGVITLLKSSVTGEGLSLPDGFEIRAALDEIKRHSMMTLAYDGAVHCGNDQNDPVMQQLFQMYCKVLLQSERQMQALERVFAAFDENGIDYMPLKGCRMKALYPRQELRTMGDADVLIRLEQYEKIVPIMKSLGFVEKVESNHELIWISRDLFLELHKRVIPSYNEDFYAYFGDGWNLAKGKDGTRYSMTAEDEFVYLFTHFTKHFRDGGIGCRHVVDLWVYLRANPSLDEACIKAELDKLQLLEFYKNIRQLMAVWFEDAPADERTDFITEFVFESGNWGQMETRFLSQMVKKSKHSAFRFNGKLMYIWNSLFPSVDGLKKKYTILNKAPYLLPVIWVYRPFYKFLFERKDVKKQTDKLSMVTNEGMKTRQKMLNYVGLDYHF